MARRRKKRWTETALKAAPKKPITTPRAEPKEGAKRKRKPDGIYYDNCKVKT